MRKINLFAALFVGACSDYSFHNEKGGQSGADDSGPGLVGDSGFTQSCDPSDHPASPSGQTDECELPEQTGSFTPVVEWTKQTFSVERSSNNVMMMPAVASLNDDNGDGTIDENDTPDIVIITYGGPSSGVLRAISGDGGTELWNLTGQPLQGQGAVAVGDIDGDGKVEIVAPTSTGLMAFENDGTVKWSSPRLGRHMYGISDAVSIADMDGDGSPECIVGNAILNADGTIRGEGAYGMAGMSGGVGTTAVAVDIDGDGVQEVVAGNALYRPDGSAIWYNGQPDGYVAVGNFDNDDNGEIVVSGNGRVRLQDDDGTVLWSSNIPGSSGYGGPPTVADFDGDGEPEIGVAGMSSYTVFDTDGTLLWQDPSQDASSGITASSVFDFEGDGVAEAVYADETTLWVFNGPDGAVKLQSDQHSNATWTEYPVVADVDGDDHVEIVVPNTVYQGSFTGITVFGDADDSWRPGRRIWNQHAYSITNVNDDGTIPAHPDRNWLTYNNFRSGDLTAATGTAGPDLVPEVVGVCEDECSQGHLYVTVQVSNQGYADIAGPVTVELLGVTSSGRVSLGTQTLSQVRAGMWEQGLEFEVDDVNSLHLSDLVASVDGGNDVAHGGDWLECDETNNESAWGRAPCE